MIRREFIMQPLLLLGMLCVVTTQSSGQGKSISLDEALSIARNNYAGLERDQFVVDQQNILAEAGLVLQPTQLYLSGEEFGLAEQTGIHSVNAQQNFYLPKVATIQKAFYKQGAVLAEKQMAFTDHKLKLQIRQAFYQLLYAKQEMKLIAENVDLFNNFLLVTTAQLESGEEGRMPQLAARSRLGQAQLKQEHANEKYQIAFSLFNHWMRSDTLYDAQGELSYGYDFSLDATLNDNPEIQIIEAQRQLAIANIETEKAQLLPQINAGFKVQTAAGSIPLFGYQLGVNIPLFKKAYRGRIEAAEVGVMIQEAGKKFKEQELERITVELRYRLEHQLHILEYLRDELTPMVNEQSQVNQSAYEEGEISYLEYLDSLEQVVKVKQQYLTVLYNFNTLRIERDYWLGK